MSLKELIIIVLSSGVVATLISSGLNYFFERSNNKTQRNFDLKQRAYMETIKSISGLGDRTADFILQKSTDKTRSLTILNYLASFQKEIAPSILVANLNVRTLLKEVIILTKDGMTIFERILSDIQKIQDSHAIVIDQALVKELKGWKERVEEIEGKIIFAMQKDLGIVNT